MVPIYNLGPVTDLVLSGQTLAQIFSGQIVTWDDDRIQKDGQAGSGGLQGSREHPALLSREPCHCQTHVSTQVLSEH